jgi:hypothetical protein
MRVHVLHNRTNAPANPQLLMHLHRSKTPHPAGIRPEQIDILITNCSIFCPTPSLASMLVNKFKLRKDVEAYHLGGMGCAVGVVAVGLVRDMLAVSGRLGGEGGGGGEGAWVPNNVQLHW